MAQFDALDLGLIFLTAGLGLALPIVLYLRHLGQGQPQGHSSISTPINLELGQHSEAILIVQAGGRVSYLNAQARAMFELGDEAPNLERLARRARPSQAFFSLCAGEGQASFSLRGSPIEGTSYRLPDGANPAILVTLKRLTLRDEGDGSVAAPAYRLIAELSQEIAASLELETILRTILESIERLVPADRAEINLSAAGSQQLVSYSLTGLAENQRRLEKKARDASAGQESSLTYKSSLGVPLEAAGERLGTLELFCFNQHGFNETNLELLKLLAGQASRAILNAQVYAGEQGRTRELAGLARLAQAVSAPRLTEELYKHLTESIAPLFNAEILGFMIYDENRRVLEGQVPFAGLQAGVLEWARLPIPADSPARQVWEDQMIIVTAAAAEDPRVQALGLHHLAVAAGIRHLVLAPLTSSGKALGYLLIGDKRDGGAFTPSELRILPIISGQAATIIENAGLMEQSRRRAQRAETLQRIASQTASNTSLDDILKSSVQELSHLLQVDHAAIFLLDETRGEVRLHLHSLCGVPEDVAGRLGRLPVDDPQFRNTVTGSQRIYFSNQVMEDARVLPAYRPIVQSLQVRSAIVAPLVSRNTSLGELMLGSTKSDFYSPADVQTVVTAAGQLAGAIERAKLSSQTDEKLRNRVDQLTAVNRINRELNSSLELKSMLQRVYDEVMKTTHADCGTVVLFKASQNGRHASQSEAPQIAIHLGDPPDPELHPLEQVVIERAETIIVKDFEQTITLRTPRGARAIPPARPAHPGVRSAMIVPIAYQENIAGLIHLHAKKPNRFDESSREIAEALSIQAAIALGNAHRYQEQVRKSELLNRRVDTMAKLLETAQALQSEQSLEQAMQNIANAIQAATPFNCVLISMVAPESQNLHRIAGTGIQPADMEVLRSHPQALSSVLSLLKPEFRIGRSYFIPYEKMPVLPAEVHTLTVLPLENLTAPGNGRSNLAWHPEDMLVVPLLNQAGEPLGLISVDAPRDNLRPDQPTIETLEVFSSQASLIIESQGRLDQLTQAHHHLEQEYEVARKSSQDNQELVRFFQRQDQEQAEQIQRLSYRAWQMGAVNRIQQAISHQATRAGALLSLGEAILAELEMDAVLLVEPGSHGPRLVYSLGAKPETAHLEALLGQRNPLTHCLQNGKQLIVPQSEADPEWAKSTLLLALRAQAFVCFTVQRGDAPELALLAVRTTTLPVSAVENPDLIARLAEQVALKLAHLQAEKDARLRLDEATLLLDFNRRIDSPEPAKILHTLLETAAQVAPGAQAGMTLLWDAAANRLVPLAAQGYTQPQHLLETAFELQEEPFGQVYRSGEALSLREVDFAREYKFSPENLLRYRKATAGKLPLATLATPIQLAAQHQSLGILILENFQNPDAFSAEAQLAEITLCQQTALHLENTRLFQAAEERASQMQALTQVAAAITSQLKPAELIATLLDQLRQIVPYETGTLWLLRGSQVVVQAARGFADEDERVGLTAAIEDSLLLSEMIVQGKPVCIGDIREDPRFPALLEPRYLSWAGIPLVSGGKVNGVIALEKSELNFYTPEHIQLATTFASQAAVALANANLFQESLSRAVELDQRTQRLEMFNRLSTALSETLDPDRILAAALQELRRAIPCSRVSAVLFDPSGTAQLLAEIPASEKLLPQDRPIQGDVNLSGAKEPDSSVAALPQNDEANKRTSQVLPDSPLFARMRESLGIFITDDFAREPELASLQDFFSSRGTRSLLALPLTTGSDLHGILLIQESRPYRFSSDEIGLARTISNQTAIAIQNARLYAETRALTADLEIRVNERTAELAQEHRRTETLLRILTELSSSLDLEQVLNRTLTLVQEIVAAGQISVLIIRPGEQKLHRLASVGYATSAALGGSPTPFATDEGLAGWVITHQEAVLIDDLLADPRWIIFTDTPEPLHRSAIAVPLILGSESLGALMLYHKQEGYFSGYHLDLVQAAANQIAVAINNAELYRLIREQAKDLGVMVRNQQIETSRSRAILEAVADGVLVTDASRKITLFNASAAKILSLKSEELIGQSLEHFTGLFGSAAHSWMETIRLWSQAPAGVESGNVHAEQIMLEDGKVVSVHLAPVTLGESFLGTVSIFRDITHQVEIDRLKSEFVATVSHELRTPMTSIKGYVEVMLMGASGSLSEQQLRFLNIIKENTDRLAILVNDLLDVSRIEAGRVTLSMQPLDLFELARSAITDLLHRSSEEHKPMQIEIEPAPDLPLALGDLERVRQIIENLLENAYYYTAERGHIRVQMQKAGEQVQVKVQDNGIGIHPELHQTVFERFYRGEHPFVLATSGTGLGLSIVRHLVEMHQGRIWLESSGVPGQGSSFYFTLPVYTANQAT